MSQLMRAAVLEKADAPFRITEVPRPIPRERQVLVRIAASGVNPLDLKIHQGGAAHARHPLPAILGLDMAGTVEAVGEGVTAFRPGDMVFGMVGGVGGVQGTLAEFAAVDADLLAPKPANLTMRAAASLPLVFITAWEGLVDRAHLQAGQSVLVLAGGGVGQLAIQIAKGLGAEVYATDSVSKAPLLERLGATAIDRNTPIEEVVNRFTGGRGFSVVFDTVGGPVLDSAFKAVGVNGHVVSALGRGAYELAPLSFKAASYSGIFTLLPLLTGAGRAHHGDIMREAARMVEAGKIVPKLDQHHFDLSGVDEAYRLMKNRGADGKLVIDIDPAHYV